MVAVHPLSDVEIGPESQAKLARLTHRAEFLGYLDRARLVLQVEHEPRHQLMTLADALQANGVGEQAALSLKAALAEPPPDSAASAGVLEEVISRNLSALILLMEESPSPEAGWKPMRDTLGDELLSNLLGISQSSLHRYVAGTRQTPDDIAARLHRAALITADLVGGYNDYGIRRWFGRPRSALDGRTPADVLRDAEDIDAPEVQRVADLAAWLVGAGSAA